MMPKLPIDQKRASFARAREEKVPSVRVAVRDCQCPRIDQSHPWLQRRTENALEDVAGLDGQSVPKGIYESRELRRNALDHVCQTLRCVQVTDCATERRCLPPLRMDAGQDVERKLALSPGRWQGPRRMVMGRA